MRIDSSDILMQSSRLAVSQYSLDERLRVWKGDTRPDFEAMERGDTKSAMKSMMRDIVDFTKEARAAMKDSLMSSAGVQAASATSETASGLSPEDDAKVQMIEILFERLTGKKIKIKIMRPEDMGTKEAAAATEHAQKAVGKAQAAQQGTERVGWGVEYDRVEETYEYENTTFSAQGIVRTSDGKEIAVSIDLSMTREFYQRSEEHLRLGDAKMKDPLVINFAGSAAELTTDKFSFDLDVDGTSDQISFVGPGSGFIALDKNSDGVVNDGSELFGAQSGDGFADLAAYDTDGNNWIDEADAVFDKLRIWTKDAEGNDQLLALGQANVGAIYLGNVSTQFDINTPTNEQQGQIQSTGLWLGETGGTGTIQQINLVV